MRRTVVAFAAGLVFALGLGMAGMTLPAKVLAFLDVFGDWDPSLAFVMAGAIAAYVPMVRLSRRMSAPVYGGSFARANGDRIDGPLLLGAAIFGIGWGIAGLCPGPAVVSVATGDPKLLAFAAAMLAGAWLFGRGR